MIEGRLSNTGMAGNTTRNRTDVYASPVLTMFLGT